MNKNPKVSIIIPFYYSEDYLIRIYINILEQSLKDIEIIFIDDGSPDNGSKIIENLQKNDKRIILLKNKKNKGLFYSRIRGAIAAKGEYIQFVDSDDLLTDYIIEKAYKIGKKNNIDIIQYKMIKEKENKRFIFFIEMEKEDIIYQPELSSIMYYGKGKLQQALFFIVNKLIKRERFLQTLIYIGNNIINENLFFQEDAMQLFCLLRVAKSLFIMKDIGYYYLRRKIYKSNFVNSANEIFHDNFIELKLIFNKTKNNKRDKDICLAYFRMINMVYSNVAKYITKGYELFDEVFTLLLNCEHFDINSKAKFNTLKNKMMLNRKDLSNNNNYTYSNNNNYI